MHLHRINLLLVLASVSISALYGTESSGQITQLPSASAAKPATMTPPANLITVPASIEYYSPFILVVDKTARTLEIWKSEPSSNGASQFNKIASYPADLGKNNGPKVSAGDHKTPEGIYTLMEKLEGTKLDFKLYGSRAYTTNYPNYFDGLDGKTGNGIWLHSVPDEVPLTRGSRGCVVVRNNIITTLDPFIHLGRTPIVISDKIETRAISETQAQAGRIEKWLESWRKAWESKNLENYLSFYDQDFKAMKMGKAEWSEYKGRLNKEYGQLKIELSQPLALEHRGRAVIRFVQSYASDKKSDLGEKILYLLNRNGDWKIVSETWEADESPAAKLAVQAKSEIRQSAQN